MSRSIRWLHLSDIHTGKDAYGQKTFFDHALDLIQQRVAAGQAPDLIFITGDIANTGKPQEYETFVLDFLHPLLDIKGLKIDGRVFIIPGNHDITRSQARYVNRYEVLWAIPEFFDPTEDGLSQRESLKPRFQAYLDADFHEWAEGDNDWLFSEVGTFSKLLQIGDVRLGIFAINTAWLCGSDDEKEKLRTGKPLFENGLKALAGCDLRIVLGHHPLNWLANDEQLPIRALLGKYGAIYLHGHEHETSVLAETGAGYPFLALEAGALFQAREDDLWANRVLLCEANLDNNQLHIEPLRWARNHQEWTIDGGAFPNAYRLPNEARWAVPLPMLPVPAQEEPKPHNAHRSSKLKLPDDWVFVDNDYLNERSNSLTNAQILGYFDGRIPGWQEAVSPEIPQRLIVSELLQKLQDMRGKKAPSILLLTGPGGEGKSTALRQFMFNLTKESAQWNVLWHEDVESTSSLHFIRNLPKSSKTWVLGSDEGDLLAKPIQEALRFIREDARTDIIFVLCARDTDWIAKQGNISFSQQDVLHLNLIGLNLEDARRIVTAWNKFGPKGLGNLVKTDSSLNAEMIEQAANELVVAARKEAQHSEGAFLGALLEIRIGENLKEHVQKLLLRLKDRPLAEGYTLFDAFTYIAALHSRNIILLTKEVLAHLIGCKLADVKRLIIGPLADEAAISQTSKFIVTRHRKVAEIAVEVLSDVFYVDFDEVIMEVTRSALELAQDGLITNLKEWRYISSRIFESNVGDHNNNQELGIRLAQMMVEMHAEDFYFRVKLSELLRRAEHFEESLQLFNDQSFSPISRNIRAYFQEWSTSASNNNKTAISIWLAGICLSDNVERTPSDNERLIKTLPSMSLSFSKLYSSKHELVYIEACAATAQIGLALNIMDERGERFLRRDLDVTNQHHVKETQLDEAVQRFKKGIIRAWEQREKDLQDWVLSAESLTFDDLGLRIGVRDR